MIKLVYPLIDLMEPEVIDAWGLMEGLEEGMPISNQAKKSPKPRAPASSTWSEACGNPGFHYSVKPGCVSIVQSPKPQAPASSSDYRRMRRGRALGGDHLRLRGCGGLDLMQSVGR